MTHYIYNQFGHAVGFVNSKFIHNRSWLPRTAYYDSKPILYFVQLTNAFLRLIRGKTICGYDGLRSASSILNKV